MNTIENMSRRNILKTVGVGSLVLGYSALGGGFSPAAFGAPQQQFTPGVFVAIDPEGTVWLTAHRSEMGQGSKTSLPMIMAEELNADWNRVKIIQGDGDAKYGDQNTDGSRSVRRGFNKMREAGAAARLMMERAAAKKWGVPAGDVTTSLHVIIHKKSVKTMGFGEAAALAVDQPVPETSELTFKARKDYGIVGKPLSVVDLPDIVTGKAVFGIDVQRDGMHYAVIQRPPVYGGRMKTFDATETLKVPGVIKVVAMPPSSQPSAFAPLGGVAVIAKNTWAALKGREVLKIDWDHGKNISHNSTAYAEQLAAASAKPGVVTGRKEGDVEAALKSADKVIDAEYRMPYYAHAPMEAPVAVAEFKDGKMEIWAPTQDPQTAQGTVAGFLKLDKANVTVHVTLLGGGFGRKSKPDFIVEAAWLARETGLSIKVTWTREDEIRHGYYHAQSVQHLTGGIDKAGRVSAWRTRSSFPTIQSTFNPKATHPGNGEMSLGLVDLPHDIPNLLMEVGDAPSHVRIGWMRSVSNIHHSFASGSFIDELAVAAGRDARDYLLETIGPDHRVGLDKLGFDANYGEKYEEFPYDSGRLSNVIRLASDKAGWGKKLPKGQSFGIAAQRSFLSYVAVVARVEVRDGDILVHEVHIAADCGLIVNPERVSAQMEGAVIFGMSLALHSEITVADGAIEQGNFDDYLLTRIDQSPDIHVHLVHSDEKPAGVGEPGVPPVAPALCNAIFGVTGKRIRKLPVADQLSA